MFFPVSEHRNSPRPRDSESISYDPNSRAGSTSSNDGKISNDSPTTSHHYKVTSFLFFFYFIPILLMMISNEFQIKFEIWEMFQIYIVGAVGTGKSALIGQFITSEYRNTFATEIGWLLNDIL